MRAHLLQQYRGSHGAPRAQFDHLISGAQRQAPVGARSPWGWAKRRSLCGPPRGVAGADPRATPQRRGSGGRGCARRTLVVTGPRSKRPLSIMSPGHALGDRDRPHLVVHASQPHPKWRRGQGLGAGEAAGLSPTSVTARLREAAYSGRHRAGPPDC